MLFDFERFTKLFARAYPVAVYGRQMEFERRTKMDMEELKREARREYIREWRKPPKSPQSVKNRPKTAF